MLSSSYLEAGEIEGRPALMVRGDFDVAAAPEVDAALGRLEQDRPPVIALDLRELAVIDSSGLRVVVDGVRRARADRRRLVVLAPPGGPVGRLLALALVAEHSDLVGDPRLIEG